MKTAIRLLCLATLGAALTARAQLSFTFTELGTLGGNASTAYGLNSSGTVVGGSTTTSSSTPFYAYSYSGGSMSNLGLISGSGNSEARAINSGGTIVGSSGITGGQTHAFSYSGGSMTDLGVISGSGGSNAWSINNDGVIVGQSSITGGATHAFKYSGGGMTDLGTLGGTNSIAWDINNSGVIVGQGQISGDTAVRAWLLTSGTLSSGNSIGTFGGTNSRAYGINDSNIAVGEAQNASGYYRAFSYNGSLTELGTLGGNSSTARDINSSSYIVGTSEITVGSGVTRAFLYMGGTMYNLNDYVSGASGWTLLEAWGINDANQVIGVAVDGSGYKHGYLLTVVPEPSTCAAIAGLGALALAAWRRQGRGIPARLA